MRYATFSSELAAPLLRQQAALLAISLAAKPEEGSPCYAALAYNVDAPMDIVYDALALGWRLKWT